MKNVSRALIVAIGLGSGAALAAQSGTTPGASVQPGQQNQGGASAVNVTGCLQRSDMTAAAVAGSGGAASTAASSTAPGSPASSSGASFVLTNASTVGAAMGAGASSSGAASGRSGASGGAAGTTTGTTPAGRGTSGTMAGGMTGAGRTYALVESKPGELAPHVGHQIEVTGTLVPGGATAGSVGTTGATAGAADSTSAGRAANAGSAMANQRLQVSSIRMIAATCSTPTPSSTAPTTTPAR